MEFFSDLIELFPDRFSGRVLDIGSANINGGPHDLLNASFYLGIDLARHANVGVVADGASLPVRSNSFDVAMSSECFEHNETWKSTLAEMVRVARPSGLIAFSAAAIGRPEHGTTRSDGGKNSPASVERGREWYENLSAKDVRRVARRLGLSGLLVFMDRRVSDIYFVAVKEPMSEGDRRAISTIRHVLAERPGPNRWPFRRHTRLLVHLFGDNALVGIERVKRSRRAS